MSTGDWKDGVLPCDKLLVRLTKHITKKQKKTLKKSFESFYQLFQFVNARSTRMATKELCFGCFMKFKVGNLGLSIVHLGLNVGHFSLNVGYLGLKYVTLA